MFISLILKLLASRKWHHGGTDNHKVINTWNGRAAMWNTGRIAISTRTAVIVISILGGCWKNFMPQMILFVNAAVLDDKYTTVKDSSGSSLMCSRTPPYSTTVVRSSIHCARLCGSSEEGCMSFNFLKQGKSCEQFTSVFNDLHIQSGCIYYTVRQIYITLICF